MLAVEDVRLPQLAVFVVYLELNVLLRTLCRGYGLGPVHRGKMVGPATKLSRTARPTHRSKHHYFMVSLLPSHQPFLLHYLCSGVVKFLAWGGIFVEEMKLLAFGGKLVGETRLFSISLFLDFTNFCS